jgi:hypothetical protein
MRRSWRTLAEPPAPVERIYAGERGTKLGDRGVGRAAEVGGLTEHHGVDTGDLPAIVLSAVAAWLAL